MCFHVVVDKLKQFQPAHDAVSLNSFAVSTTLYGGPEVQNTKQTKQNKNYVSLSFLHYFDTFLPKT